MSSLTISRLAREGGVGVETIRYYQRRGLLDRPAGDGVRRYGDGDVRRLRFIRSAQLAGFTLEEIGELLSLDASHDRVRARAIAVARLAALDHRITQLEEARIWLGRLERRCGATDSGPCPIIAAFEQE